MIVVRHFLKWIETARVSERIAGASALARAYVNHDLPFEDRCAAEAALTLLLDDPSPKVRGALAEALSMSRHAPPQVISALAADQAEVAALVLARSPLLNDSDLVDRVAEGDEPVRTLVAMRPSLSMQVSAAIAEIGEVESCLELLANRGAEIAALSFRRLVERHGRDGRMREALLADTRLPADCRHTLLVAVGQALRESPLLAAVMGQARAERVTREACLKASLTLINSTRVDEHPALIEHLRLRGELTPGFIVRTVAHGKIDFFGSILAALAGQGEARVRTLLSRGRESALKALFRQAGLDAGFQRVIVTALGVWREVANGKRIAGVQEVSWLMLRAIDATPGQRGPSEANAQLAGLLKSIHLEVLRENARGHALAIAAA